jgi:hypothetical protein
MKKFVFAAALLALTLVAVAPAKACNPVAGFAPAFAPAIGYGGSSFSASVASYGYGFNPAVTVVNRGFAFNAFTPFVTNVPQVVVNKNVIVNKNVVRARAATRVKTKTVTRTRVR